MQYVCLLVAVVGTQIVISWIGKMMYSIGDSRLQYAYFVFTDERETSMSTNILVNIFAPNIVMVFLYDVYSFLGWKAVGDIVFIFPLLYFLWRAIVICFLLNRKELYKTSYEIKMTLASEIIALVVFFAFLKRTDSYFIHVDELREELSFAIIIAVYSFVRFYLQNNVKEKDVLDANDLQKYITNKFDMLFSKYRNICVIDSCSGEIWIVLFAIMIFENFNRGYWIRRLENVKVRMGYETSVGIMQITSKIGMTDAESIRCAYDRIDKYLKDNRVNRITEDVVYDIALNYNPDESYAENVSFIYRHLESYIKEAYAEEFCCHSIQRKVWETSEESREYIHCRSFSDAMSSLQNNCTYVLEKQEGNIFDDLIESENVRVEGEPGDWRIEIHDLNDVCIDGNGSHLWSPIFSQSVIQFQNCNNVTFRNLKLGHQGNVEECSGEVLHFKECSDIVLDNIELYGCGTYGVTGFGSNIVIMNSNIHDCKCGAIHMEYGNAEIDNSVICGCGKNEYAKNLIDVQGGMLCIRGTEMFNNTASVYLVYAEQDGVTYINNNVYDNRYRKITNENVLMETGRFSNNKRLPWE